MDMGVEYFSILMTILMEALTVTNRLVNNTNNIEMTIKYIRCDFICIGNNGTRSIFEIKITINVRSTCDSAC